MATADGLDDAAKEQLYTDLASGAESGWDFSSRWLADGTNLSTIRTTQVRCACRLLLCNRWHDMMTKVTMMCS